MIEKAIISFQRRAGFTVPLILAWGEENFRKFIWRKSTDNIYHLLTAEILLQKTLAGNVEKIFPKLLQRYPDVNSLKNADINDVKEVIRPTGLQDKKASALIQMASWLDKNSVTHFDNISSLKNDVKGISDYVYNAILIFHFKKKVPLIDVNIQRIVKRILGGGSKYLIENFLRATIKNISKTELSQFYFSMLDLGAKICTLNNPKCRICPLCHICKYSGIDADAAIVTGDEYSVKRFVEEKVYWRFANSSFKKLILYIALNEKSPTKKITHVGKIESVGCNKNFVNYNFSAVAKISPPIEVKKGEYPPVSYKYTKFSSLINALSLSDL